MSGEVEEWRPVVGYEGLYEVSSLGRVRSLDREVLLPKLRQQRRYTGQILKQQPHRERYPQVKLSKNGRVKNLFVHVLVCEAWHGPRIGNQQVAHWDNDRENARLSNLRWATRSENEADKVRHGTAPRGVRASNAKLTAEAVVRMRQAAAEGARGTDLAREYDVAKTTVSNVIRRRNWAWLD